MKIFHKNNKLIPTKLVIDGWTVWVDYVDGMDCVDSWTAWTSWILIFYWLVSGAYSRSQRRTRGIFTVYIPVSSRWITWSLTIRERAARVL